VASELCPPSGRVLNSHECFYTMVQQRTYLGPSVPYLGVDERWDDQWAIGRTEQGYSPASDHSGLAPD